MFNVPIRKSAPANPPVDASRDLIDRVAKAPAVAEKLRGIRAGKAVVFEHVTESAQPFLAALIALGVKKRFWVVCENVRAQETFHNELVNWMPDALFFPTVETPAARGALVDPEITAERLDALQRLSGKGDLVVVAAAGSLDDDVPAPESLERTTLNLAKGSRVDREGLLTSLGGAGYERVEQVNSRGQYAVRGGIVDVFSWQHALPVRIELFDDVIESIRQFDLDTQTLVQPLDSCGLLLGEVEEKSCLLRDYIGSDVVIDTCKEGELENRVAGTSTARIMEGARPEAGGEERYAGAFHEHGLGEFDAGDLVIGGIETGAALPPATGMADGEMAHLYFLQ